MKGMALIMAFALFSVANAQTPSSSSLLCNLHIYCPPTNSTPLIRNSTAAPGVINLNNTINKTGNVSLSYVSDGVYTYNVTLQKSGETGISAFLLLGMYENRSVYIPSTYTNCTITSQIFCQTVFIINIGTYSRMEVGNNGKWLYALKLPSNVSGITAINVVVQQSNSSPLLLIVVIVSICVAAFIAGNIIYYKRHEGELSQFRVNKK